MARTNVVFSRGTASDRDMLGLIITLCSTVLALLF